MCSWNLEMDTERRGESEILVKTEPKVQQGKEWRDNKLKVEVRAAEGDNQPKKIIGYAVKWNKLSGPIFGSFQEKFQKGAFSKCLRNKPDVVASWQHNLSEILGRTTAKTLQVEEDNIGLRYEINPPSWADDHLETIKRGDVTGSSFIFRAVKDAWDASNPDMEIRTVLEADLIEVSPVTFPAYSQSEAGVRSGKDVFKEHRKPQRNNCRMDLRRKYLNLLEKS